MSENTAPPACAEHPVFKRIRATISEFSVIPEGADLYAAKITLEVLKAKATRKVAA